MRSLLRRWQSPEMSYYLFAHRSKQMMYSSSDCASRVPNRPQLDTSDPSVATLKFCLKHVEKYDRENYLAGLYIEDKLLRRINFALRAFNVELSLIRDQSNNSDRAKIRFHFWSRLIDEIARRNSNPNSDIDSDKDMAYYRQTPVAKELLDLFSFIEFTKEHERYLRDLIGARISSKVLGYKPFETLAELETYCAKSNSSIYHLAWRIGHQLKQPDDQNCDDSLNLLDALSENLGKAQGLCNILRGIPYNSTKNCCYIPLEILDKFNLSNRNFVGKSLSGDKVQPAVKYIADHCQVLLSHVYLSLSRFSSESQYYQYRQFKNLFLPRVSIESSLKRLKRYNYNICEPSLHRRNELLALNLKMASIYHKAPVF